MSDLQTNAASPAAAAIVAEVVTPSVAAPLLAAWLPPFAACIKEKRPS